MSHESKLTILRKGDSLSISLWRRSSGSGASRTCRILKSLGNAVLVAAYVTGPVQPFSAASHEGQTPPGHCAPFGEHRLFRLEDGTNLQLNSGTCATALYSPRLRFLQQLGLGESLLDVAPDPTRPFVMQTDQATIQVIGTRFNLYRGVLDDATKEVGTRISTLDGRIQITIIGSASQDTPILLTAGQQLDILDTGAVKQPKHLTKNNITQITAWTRGEIEVDGTIKDILHQLVRYHHVCFKTTDSRIPDEPYNGTIHSTEVNRALTLLSEMGIRSFPDHDGSHQPVITLTRNDHTHSNGKCL